MDKVHILIWAADGRIGGVYADYEKACRIAENSNKKRSWIHLNRLLSALVGKRTEWLVQTFDVK